MITVIDLGTSNLQSVARAFARAGEDVVVTDSAADTENADVLVLPGVGAFEEAMGKLRERGFEPVIRRHALERRRPLVGICLGMQLLADRSHENGLTGGLALISGDVRKLEPAPPDYRVPNVGWRNVKVVRPSKMFPANLSGSSFYHVHSYHLVCADPEDVVATFEFGGDALVTAVERENVFGVQFHPEKSQDAGLTLLEAVLGHIQSGR